MISFFLSVIIPAHNEGKTICRTINSLLYQDYSYFEIVIVVDGSNDDTDEKLINCFDLCLSEKIDNLCVLKHKLIVKIYNKICNNVDLYLVQKENGGKSDALNAGISFCHGDYYICIDADCTFPINTLSCLTKALYQSKNIIAVGGRVLPSTGLDIFFSENKFHLKQALLSYQELEYGIAFCIVRTIFDKLKTSMLISGALGLSNKEIVIQLGGYSVDTVGEDMELVMRIRQFIVERGETSKRSNMLYTTSME